MVVALIALVVALTGTAVATTSRLSGPQAKQVVKIANRRITKRAPKLTVARAHFADNATSLGGLTAASFLHQSDLPPTPVSGLAPHSGWESIGGGAGAGPARAYLDQLGVAHLAGLVGRVSGSDNVALTLPDNLRPAYMLEFPTVSDTPGIIFNPVPGIVLIYPDGGVHPITTASSECFERLSLDGITLRPGD